MSGSGPLFARHYTHVSAFEARQHLLTLADSGIGVRQAAKLSQLGTRTIRRIRNGELTTIKPSTAQAVLAVKPLPALGARVEVATSRLIHILAAHDFSRETLSERIGLRVRWFARDHACVRMLTVLRIRAFFRQHMRSDAL